MSLISRSPRPLARAVTAVATALLLATGCGVGSDESIQENPPAASAVPRDANDADRHFVEQLQPHHDQAIEMSKMVLAKESGVDPEVRALAEQIVATSEKELERINSWLTSWGPAATAGHGSEEEPDHHGGTGGLMTEGQMQLLDQLDGPTAQQVYLEGMVKHHQGAVALTETQIREGRHPEAVAFSREVLARQQSEIARLQELRAG